MSVKMAILNMKNIKIPYKKINIGCLFDSPSMCVCVCLGGCTSHDHYSTDINQEEVHKHQEGREAEEHRTNLQQQLCVTGKCVLRETGVCAPLCVCVCV